MSRTRIDSLASERSMHDTNVTDDYNGKHPPSNARCTELFSACACVARAVEAAEGGPPPEGGVLDGAFSIADPALRRSHHVAGRQREPSRCSGAKVDARGSRAFGSAMRLLAVAAVKQATKSGVILVHQQSHEALRVAEQHSGLSNTRNTTASWTLKPGGGCGSTVGTEPLFQARPHDESLALQVDDVRSGMVSGIGMSWFRIVC